MLVACYRYCAFEGLTIDKTEYDDFGVNYFLMVLYQIVFSLHLHVTNCSL